MYIANNRRLAIKRYVNLTKRLITYQSYEDVMKALNIAFESFSKTRN